MNAAKRDTKRPGKAKAADTDEGDPGGPNAKKQPGRAKAADTDKGDYDEVMPLGFTEIAAQPGGGCR